jgi:hypothetical protein
MAGPANGILGQLFPPTAPLPGPLGGLLPPQVVIPGAGPPQLPGNPQPLQAGYFVDRLPKVIRKKLGKSTLADQCMDAWITQKRNINPEAGLVGDVCRCILDVQQVKAWDKTKLYKAGVPDFARAERNVGGLITVVSFLFDRGPLLIKTRFPTPDVPARPPGIKALTDFTRNDAEWAKQVEQWRISSVTDGDTELDLNELSFLLGNYNWCWLYTGEAQRFVDPNPNQSLDPDVFNPNLIKVTVKQVGIYAVDAYDFVDRTTFEKTAPGGQPLGFWNVDDGDEEVETVRIDPGAVLQNFKLCSDAGYYPKMGRCYVTNGVFNRYRETVKDRGGDFFIYSTIEFHPHSFTFFYNQRTKKQVNFTNPPF